MFDLIDRFKLVINVVFDLYFSSDCLKFKKVCFKVLLNDVYFLVFCFYSLSCKCVFCNEIVVLDVSLGFV